MNELVALIVGVPCASLTQSLAWRATEDPVDVPSGELQQHARGETAADAAHVVSCRMLWIVRTERPRCERIAVDQGNGHEPTGIEQTARDPTNSSEQFRDPKWRHRNVNPECQ